MIMFNKYYPDEFKKLRHAGKISSQCLDLISDKIKPELKHKKLTKCVLIF